MVRVICLFAISFLMFQNIFAQQYGSFKDSRDGKLYKTVKIGGQEWMAENLTVTKFQNGDIIPQASTRYDWNEANKNKTPAWCYVDYNSKNEIIYNLYAVLDKRGIAPKGWQVPTLGEFINLVIQAKNTRSRKDTINDKWGLPSNITKLQSKYQWIIRRSGFTTYKTYTELRKDSIELSEKLSKELNSNNNKFFQSRMNELTQELSEVKKFETDWNERANNSGFSAIPTGMRNSTIFDSRLFNKQVFPSVKFYKTQSFEKYFEWESGVFNICSSLEKIQYENTKNMWPVEGTFSVIDDTIFINPPRYLSKSEMKFVNKQEYRKSNLPYQDIIYKIILNKNIDTIFNSSKDVSQNEKYYLKKRFTINSIITYDLTSLRVIDFPDTIIIDQGNNWKFQNGEYLNSASANWWTATQFHDTKFENQVGHKCSKECEHPLGAYVFRITNFWPYQILWSQIGYNAPVFNPEWMNGGSGLSVRCIKENSQLIIDTADADYLTIPLAKREEFGIKAKPILKIENPNLAQKNTENTNTKNTSNFVKIDPKNRHICSDCKGAKYFQGCDKCDDKGVLKCTSCSGTGEKLADKYVNCLGELDYPGKYCSRCKGSCSWATTVYYKSGVKCLDCRGNGLIYCSECNGKPQVHRYKCESCEGIGYKKFVVCNYCKGELPKKNELSAEMNAFIFGKCNMCEGSGKLSRPLSY